MVLPSEDHLQLPLMLLSAMKHSENDHGIAMNLKEDFVRKAPRQSPTKFAVIEREGFRILFQPNQDFPDREQKFTTQARALILIPIMSNLQIRPGFTSDGDLPFHARRVRISARTSPQRFPGSRSRSNSSRASSRSCRSAAEGSAPLTRSASCNSESRANNCERSLGLSFGSSSKISTLLTL